jgi:hypothetical protein
LALWLQLGAASNSQAFTLPDTHFNTGYRLEPPALVLLLRLVLPDTLLLLLLLL